MQQGKIGVIILEVEDRSRTMVLEGLKTEDRPLAVGYFLLDTLRSFFQSGVSPEKQITIKCGLIEPAKLQKAVDENATHVFLPPIAAVQDLGSLYKLILAVSRGERREL